MDHLATYPGVLYRRTGRQVDLFQGQTGLGGQLGHLGLTQYSAIDAGCSKRKDEDS